MIHTDVGCCCSLPDVVSSVVFFCCFLFCQQVSKQIVCFFCFSVFFFFFFFSLLSLTIPILLFSLSLSPFSVDFPRSFFFFFFFFFSSFSPFFLCPLVLSIIVWLIKGYIKLKLIIKKKKKKKKAVNDDSIVTHTHCYVLSVLLTGQKKKKKRWVNSLWPLRGSNHVRRTGQQSYNCSWQNNECTQSGGAADSSRSDDSCWVYSAHESISQAPASREH